jgi:RimJ/RimL family protein N-acetyltransferase
LIRPIAEQIADESAVLVRKGSYHPTMQQIGISRVTPSDWTRLRTLRLAALAESPEMFGWTLAREQAFDETEWRARAERPATFIASRDDVDMGIAGVFRFPEGWCVMGMWVSSEARGLGTVDALLHACEGFVGTGLVGLWVMEDNPRGSRAYSRLGYSPTETRQHVRDNRFEVLMVKVLA